jgi:hypothetical protein
MYTSVVSEANGMGWGTDYPYAGINLMTRVSELTKTPIRTKRRIGRETLRVVEVFIAGQSAVDGLPQEIRH